MPICRKEHGGVAMTVAIAFGRFDQFGIFGGRQVLALAIFGVRPPYRSNKLADDRQCRRLSRAALEFRFGRWSLDNHATTPPGCMVDP
jgi:hypothetical protein